MSTITKQQAKWERSDFEGLVFPSMIYFKQGGTSYSHKAKEFQPSGIQSTNHILTYEDMDNYEITFDISTVTLKTYNIQKIKGT